MIHAVLPALICVDLLDMSLPSRTPLGWATCPAQPTGIEGRRLPVIPGSNENVPEADGWEIVT
jgi:hypothetical protein